MWSKSPAWLGKGSETWRERLQLPHAQPGDRKDHFCLCVSVLPSEGTGNPPNVWVMARVLIEGAHTRGTPRHRAWGALESG